MLILSRKNGETLHLGNDIKVTVIGQRRGETLVGIEAPDSIKVARAEKVASEPCPKNDAMLDSRSSVRKRLDK